MYSDSEHEDESDINDINDIKYAIKYGDLQRVIHLIGKNPELINLYINVYQTLSHYNMV